MTKTSLFFDLLTILLAIGCLILMYWAYSYIEDQPLKLLLITIGSLGFVFILYSSFVETNRLVCRQLDIMTEKTKRDIKIVLFSDIGIGTFKGEKFLDRVVNLVNSMTPDIIIIAGDAIDDRESSIQMLEGLKKLTSHYGIYFSLGNHEYKIGKRFIPKKGRLQVFDQELGNKVASMISSLGIHVLRNTKKEISVKDKAIEIYGIDDFQKDPKAFEQLKISETNNFKILISHNPDINVQKEFCSKFDLILCGHTHGGQVRLPWFGSIIPQPIKSNQRKFSKGLVKLNEKTNMIISSGVGESSLRMRFCDPPEIMIVNITNN